jgi:hypothetical protein
MTAGKDFCKYVPNGSLQKQTVLWSNRPCSITLHISSSQATHNIFLYIVKGESTRKRASCVKELRTVTDGSVNFRSFEICTYNRNNQDDSTSLKGAHSSTD